MPETISSTKLRANLKNALTYVKESKKPLIITERGHDTTVLIDVDEYEDLLMYQDKEFMDGLRRSIKEHKEGTTKTYSLEEVKESLGIE